MHVKIAAVTFGLTLVYYTQLLGSTKTLKRRFLCSSLFSKTCTWSMPCSSSRPNRPERSTMSSRTWNLVPAKIEQEQNQNRTMCASGKCDSQELCGWEHRFWDTKRAIELLRAHCAMITSSAVYKPQLSTVLSSQHCFLYFPKRHLLPTHGLRISPPN